MNIYKKLKTKEHRWKLMETNDNPSKLMNMNINKTSMNIKENQ